MLRRGPREEQRPLSGGPQGNGALPLGRPQRVRFARSHQANESNSRAVHNGIPDPFVTGIANQSALTVTNLVKRYPKGKTNAVDDVSFAVRRGEIFGLL